MMIPAVVTAGRPPSASLTAMPMAVVMLLGSREASMGSSMAKTRRSTATHRRLAAKLQIQLAAKLDDPLPDVAGLHLQVFLVVKRLVYYVRRLFHLLGNSE